MAELRPRSQWRWYTRTDKDPASMLNIDCTVICLDDGEAFTEIYVAPRLVRRVLDEPESMLQRMIGNLKHFKAKEQYNKICGGSDD